MNECEKTKVDSSRPGVSFLRTESPVPDNEQMPTSALQAKSALDEVNS